MSIVIPAYNARRTIGLCLGSLARQQGRTRFEIIVVDSSTDGTAGLIGRDHPWVRLLGSPDRLHPGRARNLGVEAAAAEIVAFIDADCQAEPGWLETLLAGYRQGHRVVGGGVANARPGDPLGQAYHWCEFAQWLPKGKPRPVPDQPTANILYDKAVLKSRGGFREEGYCSDTDFHRRMAGEGLRPFFIPSAVVSHLYLGTPKAFLRHEFAHGRYFGAMRSRSEGWSPARRAVYACLAPLALVKLFIQKTAHILPPVRPPGRFLRPLPFFILGLASWAAGEAAGYLGAGTRSEESGFQSEGLFDGGPKPAP